MVRQKTQTAPWFIFARSLSLKCVHIYIICGVAACIFTSSDAARNAFVIPENTGCACPGAVLTYTCTACGRGSTLWMGTAFDCDANGILLRHDRFTDSRGIDGVCNNGAIFGQSVGVENGCYTSELNVTISPTLNNKTVTCIHNGDRGIDTIGASKLTIMQAPNSPPNDVHLLNVDEGMLQFSWTYPVPNCSSVSYVISSDCGSCPGVTTATNVTCSDLELSPNATTCTFSVQSVICGNNGESSGAVMVTLKLPDAPMMVKIVPIYSSDNQSLVGFTSTINQETPFTISGGILGTVTGYQITYLNSSFGIAGLVNKSSCGDEVCEYIFDVPSSLCDMQSHIYVTLMAISSYGMGPPSNSNIIGCSNEFVGVEYDSTTSTITCTFLNKSDSSKKMCHIQYGVCGQMMNQMEMTSTSDASDRVTLKLRSLSSASYCYTLTASNDSTTVVVKGQIESRAKDPVSLAAIIIPTVTIVMVVTMAAIILGIVIIFMIKRKSAQYYNVELRSLKNVDESLILKDDDIVHLKLTAIDVNERKIVPYVVEHDCALKEFIEEKGLTYTRGLAFYEFTHSVESITKDKELIIMSKESKKYYNPGIGPGPKELCNRKLLGERVLRPSLEKYRLFVQSTGSGARHLPRGSILLYESLVPHPLLHVDEDQFTLSQVQNDSTLKDWCQARSLDFSENSVFLELHYIEKDKEIHDAILKDKDTKQLLTGPRARQMVKKHRDGIQEIDMEQWMVFVLSRCEETFEFKRNMWVLYHKLEEKERLSEEFPLVHIKSGQYASKKLDRDYQLKQFCEEHCLDCHVPNVFVKIGRVDLSKPGAKVVDVMLMNKKSGDLYTGPTAWKETQKYKSGANKLTNKKSPWRVLVLSNLDENSMLSKNSWVLYRVNKSPWKANGLMRVHSNHFVSAQMKSGSKLSDVWKLQGKECDVFLEPGSFHENIAAGRDVILMDENTKELFTGPFARQLLKQFEVGGKCQEESHRRWKVFAHNKSEKDFVCTKDTLVWYKNHKQSSQMFHVVKVDVDNVRMSNFVTEKLNLDFDNGKAFYEFNQPEDLLYHKEVVVMPVEGESELPVNGELECSFRSFYEISGTPGMDIQPISFEKSSRVFIQSLSQGCRCLKRGSLILYKKDEAQQTK